MNNNNNEIGGFVDLVLSFFNQYMFNDAKTNITDLKYFFDSNPSTSGNPLVENLLGAIKDYSLENIGLPLFQSILAKSGKNEKEGKEILNKIIEYKQYGPDQILPAKKYLNDVLSSVYIQRANTRYQDDPSGFVEYLKSINIKLTDDSTNYMTSRTFDKLDINSIIAAESPKGIKSTFDFINNSFQPECCYPNHGLVCMSAPPGSGKSLFAMNEALGFAKQGFKVLYICLGDMSEKDFIIRMAAMHTGLPFWEIKKDLNRAYEELKKSLGDNLELVIAPSNVISCDDIIEYVKNHNYLDVIMIDYDSNVKTNVMTDSLYLTYREMYSRLSELTIDMKKLVFILAQPMKASWSLPIIDITDVGESAGKIHACDLGLSRGREPENLNGLGTFFIFKNRSGNERVIDYSIRLNNGRFLSLPKGVFDDIKQIKEKRDFSEGEIRMMVQSYNMNRRAVQNKLNTSTSRVGPGPKPF